MTQISRLEMTNVQQAKVLKAEVMKQFKEGELPSIFTQPNNKNTEELKKTESDFNELKKDPKLKKEPNLNDPTTEKHLDIKQ